MQENKPIYVIKKNGTKELFDITKIKNMSNFACEGLEVNPLLLESKISLTYRNLMTTSDIQQNLIGVANSLISIEEPDWSIVAGRLATKLLHNEIYKNTKFEGTQFPEFLNFAVSKKLYRSDFISFYTAVQINKLSENIDPKKDFKFTLAQVSSLKDKYLIRNKKGYLEYPQFSDMASSMILATVEPEVNRMDQAAEFFILINEELISLGTPFKANLRLLNGNTASCFILPIGDSLAQIAKSWTDVASISKAGGGIGLYFGYLRPGNTYTQNVVKSNKINRWVKIINDIAIAVNQRGIRPGAVTPALDWWHLDIEDFIEMKTETGQMDLRDKCFDLFPQLVGDRYFFEAAKHNMDVYLFNHYELEELTGINIIPLIGEELYNAHLKVKELIETGKLKHYKKINAKELWKEAFRVWFETGDFYITSKDGLNISNYLKDFAVSNCANLCIESFSLNTVPENWESKGTKDGIITTETDGLYHSCNLISINVANCVGPEAENLLKRACYGAVRALDNSIDTGVMPVLEALNSSKLLRNIGIGTVGVADWMAYNKYSYEKEDGLLALEALQERISYHCYNASIDLAIEKGSYPYYEKANYDTLFGKTGEELDKMSLNNFCWSDVIKRIKQYGIRNFLLIAIAPNTSSGLVQNAVASFLPPHSKFNIQTLSNLSVPVIPKYLKIRNWYYKSKFNYDPVTIIEVTKRLQRWVDTGISMEIPINTEIANGKTMSDAFLDGFIKNELKGIYYSVSVDGDKGCTDCKN
jgi:ribonucleoside-diphosphate reductase alpha chain